MRTTIPLTLVAMLAAGMALAVDDATLVVRHEHYFVIVNAEDTAPTISVQSKAYYTYGDALEIVATNPEGKRLLRTLVPLTGNQTLQIPGEVAEMYLVVARPGMNGVIFDCDRPWGVAATDIWGLGSNNDVPPMYLYVPPECEELTLNISAPSPREGGRIRVLRPDGGEALVMDGEFDEPQEQTIAVTEDARGRVWSLLWDAPQTVPGSLDDINVTVSGYLAPLLWPKAEWAAEYGPEIWTRHKAAIDGEG